MPSDRRKLRLARRVLGGLGLILVGLLLRDALPLPLPEAWAGTDAGAHAAERAAVSGRWRPFAPRDRDPGTPVDQDAESARLAAIGYAGAHPSGRRDRGVTLHEPALAWTGRNLWNSGHAQTAFLADMQGRVLHAWRYDVTPLLSAQARSLHGGGNALAKWRRVRAGPDGSLLAIYEGVGLLKLDRDSKLLWFHEGGEHHDLDVDAETGEIWTLARTAHMVWRVSPFRPTLEDEILVLDADGNERMRLSVLDALDASPWAPLLDRLAPSGDVTHTNTIERLDGRFAERMPAFARGNLLVSIRELDTVAVIDPRAGQVVWALSGPWDAQHQPTLLDDGRLLVFDNKGARGWSRVLELDPWTQRVTWSYVGDHANGFRSAECGSVQRLPNGNTLVTETDSGRAFEVTREGRIVWEFVNPHREGPEEEYIAALYEVVRLPPDFGDDWLAVGDG